MNLLIVFLVVVGVFCEEMAVTREHNEHLNKHVDSDAANHEENIFRGSTMDEFKALLLSEVPVFDEDLPKFEADKAPPSKPDWDDKCLPPIKKQKEGCGSSWALAVAAMLTTRCCLSKDKDKDRIPYWLSAQELISCDTRNHGCKGGWPSWALKYVAEKKGLVRDECLPYEGTNTVCPHKCTVSGKNWNHECNCYGAKQCIGLENMKACLESGPITVTFAVDDTFATFKGEIYDCKGKTTGLYSALAVEHSPDNAGNCYWKIQTSLGEDWGEKGFAKIACQNCGIHGLYNNGNVMCELVK